MKRVTFFFIVLLFAIPAHADEVLPEQTAIHEAEQALLNKHDEVWKMWAMSRNYRHGTTLAKDLVLAYAWLDIYVNSLPPSYPGMKKALADLKGELSEEDVLSAKEQIPLLREKYDLNYRLSEKDLREVFAINERKAIALQETEEVNDIDAVEVAEVIKAIDNASVVGYIDASIQPANVNIILKKLSLGEAFDEPEDPWHKQMTHINIMPDGQFYANNLSAARYRLAVSSDGNVIKSVEINLRAGQRHNVGDLKA